MEWEEINKRTQADGRVRLETLVMQTSFEKECPYFAHFLYNFVFEDIQRPFKLGLEDKRHKGMGYEIRIYYTDSEGGFSVTPLDEINGWPLPVLEPFVLGAHDPFSANNTLRKYLVIDGFA